jgi:hypothetical protein
VAEFVDENDGIELLEIELLIAEPLNDLVEGGGFTDESEFRVHHAAGGGGIEGEEFADFGGFLIGHFFEEFLGGFLGQVGEEVGGSVGSHLLDDVGGFLGVEFFDDLRGEALVEFGENGGGSFLVEGGDDALTLGGGELFHHLGEVGGVEVLEFLVGDAELNAAERVGLDEVDEFPANGALGKLAVELTEKSGRSNALQEAADRAREANIDLSDAKFDIAVGALFGKINVVDTDDLAASSVNDLLIEEIFLHSEPSFVGLISAEGALIDIEIDAAGSNLGDLVVAGDERLEASTGDEEVRDAIGLLGGFDEEFADAADVVGLIVIGSGAHEFGGVEQVEAPFDGAGPICQALMSRPACGKQAKASSHRAEAAKCRTSGASISAGKKQKTRDREKPARVGDSNNGVPLAGGESSHGRSTLSAGPKAGQRASGGNRRHRPSGPFASATQDKRVAVVPHPRATRVRFEFARRAHQREITPKVGINLAERSCQGESDDWREKSETKFETGRGF